MFRWNIFSLEASPDRAAFITLPFVGNGFIYVNGHCIGRTWKADPQRRYYIPECWLNKDGKNRVAVSTILSK